MAFDSVFRCRGFLLSQLKAPGVDISRTLSQYRNTECVRKKIVPRYQRRTLVTAVTYSPRVILPESSPRPPARVAASLVDAALSWASVNHRSADPPSHAIILVSKELIPTGKAELLRALSKVEQLRGLDAVIGVVDYVESGSKGASVLLASKSENVTIERLSGVEREDLRVGRWHAKDVEEDGPIDFDNMMASIRGTEAPIVVAEPKSTSEKELLFVVGEAKAIQGQISGIRQTYPNATIMGTALATTPTINGLFTTMIHNGVIIPSGDMVAFRIPRSESENYSSPTLEHNMYWLGEKNGRTITSCSGNLILEIDNTPAMPQLLSLLPRQSKLEELNPRPLVAEILATDSDSSSFCVNVLGGSRSRGGIALDPLVASGRLAIGKKIRFAQAPGAMKSNFYTPQDSKGVHICFHSTDPRSAYVSINETTRDFDQRGKPPVFQGLRKGLFCAESGEGFLMGEKGVVPWLCRVPGSTAKLLVTATTTKRHALASRPMKTVASTRMTAAWAHWTAVQDESFRWGNMEQGVHEIESTGVSSDDETELPVVPVESPSTTSQPPIEEPIQPTRLGLKRFKLLPTEIQALVKSYPRTAKLILSGKHDLRSIPYDSRWYYNKGDRRFSFRARADWFPFRAGTLKRSDLWQYGPGGTKLARQRRAMYKAPTKAQAWENQQLSIKYADWLKSRKDRNKANHIQTEIKHDSDENEENVVDEKETTS